MLYGFGVCVCVVYSVCVAYSVCVVYSVLCWVTCVALSVYNCLCCFVFKV